MNLLDNSPFKRFIFTKRGLTFVISLILGSILTVLILLNFLPFTKDIFNQLFPKPPAKAASTFPDILSVDLGIEGPVWSIVATDTAAYIGGFIQYVGPNTGSWVPINISTGVASSTYARVFGDVRSAIPDGSGGWYIGGQFTKIGSATRNHLAHILADGTLDSSFDPNADAIVEALALSADGKTLYAGGNFRTIGGQTRNFFAAIETATGTVTPLTLDFTGAVRDLKLSTDGGTLYVGGSFGFIIAGAQEYTRQSLAAIELAGGTITPFDPAANANATVNIILLNNTGTTLYVGGDFTTMGGQARNRIAAINTSDGTVVSAFNPNADGAIRELVLTSDENTLYVGGQFTTIGSQSRNYLAALDAGTGTANPFNPGSSDNVSTLEISSDGSTLYVGGRFTNIGGQPRNYLAAFEIPSGTIAPFNPNPSYEVYELAFSPGDTTNLYVGGEFVIVGGQARNWFAAVDADGNVLPLTIPSLNDAVYTLLLAPDGKTLYVGGVFNGGLVSLDITTGEVTHFNLIGVTPLRQIDALAISKDGKTLYIGGNFTTILGQPRNNIAAIDTETKTLKPFNPNADRFVRDLLLNGDDSILYVGGQFTTIGGQARTSIAALETATGSATLFNPAGADRDIRTLLLSNDESTLYVGGQFTTIGGQARNLIAAINTADSSILPFDPNVSGGAVNTLVFSSDRSILYMGGCFDSVGGQPRDRLASVNVSDTSVTSWNPSVPPESCVATIALSPDNTRLYAGGSFIGHTLVYVAAVPSPTPTPTPTPIPTPTPEPPPPPAGGPAELTPAGPPAAEPAPAGPPAPPAFVPVIPLAAPVTGRGQ